MDNKEEAPSKKPMRQILRALFQASPYSNREEIESTYTVEQGIIRSPGKFENQPVYVVYFWEIYLNGFADRDDGKIIGFDLTLDDKLIFPELKGRRTVNLMEDNQGFVTEV